MDSKGVLGIIYAENGEEGLDMQESATPSVLKCVLLLPDETVISVRFSHPLPATALPCNPVILRYKQFPLPVNNHKLPSMGRRMTFIFGCRKTVINMVLFSGIPVIKRSLPELRRKSGITGM